MNQLKGSIGAAIAVTALFVALDVRAADCGRQIAASGPAARTVVLAGGDAWSLFRQFLSHIEQRNLDVSVRKSRVILSHDGRIETIELGWRESLAGPAAETLWQRRLSGKHAGLDPQLLADARVSHWDIVCIGKVAAPPAREQRAPAARAAPGAQEALLFYKSGVHYASRGDYRNALKEFEAAEKIAPGLEGLLMNLGVTHLQLTDYVRASEYLRRAIDQNPRDAAAHYNLACLQARLGQHRDAIASLTAAKHNGLKMTATLRRDPDLASLRGRRDFETLFQ